MRLVDQDTAGANTPVCSGTLDRDEERESERESGSEEAESPPIDQDTAGANTPVCSGTLDRDEERESESESADSSESPPLKEVHRHSSPLDRTPTLAPPEMSHNLAPPETTSAEATATTHGDQAAAIKRTVAKHVRRNRHRKETRGRAGAGTGRRTKKGGRNFKDYF